MWRGRQVTDTARFRQLYEAASGAALQTMTARDIAAAEAMQSLWVALPGVFTQLELAERDRAKLATIKELNQRAIAQAELVIAERNQLRALVREADQIDEDFENGNNGRGLAELRARRDTWKIKARALVSPEAAEEGRK